MKLSTCGYNVQPILSPNSSSHPIPSHPLGQLQDLLSQVLAVRGGRVYASARRAWKMSTICLLVSQLWQWLWLAVTWADLEFASVKAQAYILFVYIIHLLITCLWVNVWRCHFWNWDVGFCAACSTFSCIMYCSSWLGIFCRKFIVGVAAAVSMRRLASKRWRSSRMPKAGTSMHRK